MSGTVVKVDYVARVEGEASLYVEIKDREVKKLELNVFEPPRFFEGFLIGRKLVEAPQLVARICGICPVSHMLTSIRAAENILGITPSEQTRKLRKLLALSQIIASHNIHVYMLALPDYLGYESVIAMLPSHSEDVKRALRIKKAANELTRIIGGRPLHPMTPLINGFTRLPRKQELEKVGKELEGVKEDALETVRMLSRIKTPTLKRKPEYVALRKPDEYAVNEGNIVSSEGLNIQEQDYAKYFEEKQVPHSYAKHSNVKKRGSFMVGALARLNLNYDWLSKDAKAVAKEAGLSFPVYNSFAINMAQAVEIVHCIDECVNLIGEIDLREEDKSFEIKAGEACALTEAPRGLLQHNYKINKEGVIVKADIVTPTAHNVLNMENDLRQLIPEVLNRSQDEITLLCEELIRSYDPCFSCSVHFLKLNIRKMG